MEKPADERNPPERGPLSHIMVVFYQHRLDVKKQRQLAHTLVPRLV